MNEWMKKHGYAIMTQMVMGAAVSVFSVYVTVREFSVRLEYMDRDIARIEKIVESANIRIDQILGGG